MQRSCLKYQRQAAHAKKELNQALDELIETKFHRENESRLNNTLKSQLQDCMTQVELAKSNLAHIREKLRENEGRTEGLVIENSQLRDMVQALDFKNK